MRTRLFSILTALLFSAVASSAQIIINELMTNQDTGFGTDSNEYVEVKGPPLQSLDNLFLLEIEGAHYANGRVDGVTDLSGYNLGANGLAIVGVAPNFALEAPYTIPPETTVLQYGKDWLEADSITIMLVSNFTGVVGDSIDLDDDGVIDALSPFQEVLDSVGYSDGSNESNVVYSTAKLIHTGVASPDGASRFTDAVTPFALSDWYAGDLIVAGAEPLRITYDPATSTANLPAGGMQTPGDVNMGAFVESPPAFVNVDDLQIRVGDNVSLEIVVNPTDGDAVTSLTAPLLPAGSSFVSGDAANTNGTFTWNSASPIGVYTSRFEAVDNDGTSTQTVLIYVSAASPIVISEIMQNPAAVSDSAGEWFEIYNKSGTAVDIEGWTVKDDGGDSFVIANGGPLMVPAMGYLVLGNNADFASNGGVNVDYEYTGMYIGNSADEIVIVDLGDVEKARVEYDGGPNWPDPNGASMFLTELDEDFNDPGNWDTSLDPWPGGAGDKGTPGASNFSLPLPPVVDVTSPQGVVLGGTLTFEVVVEPTNGDPIDSLQMLNLPGTSSFTLGDLSNTNGTFEWVSAGPLGTYTSRVEAADSDGVTTQEVLIVVSTPAEQNILITEVMQNPAAVGDFDGEWFEIYNKGAAPIDVNGWTIEIQTGARHLIANGGPLMIAPGEYLVLADDADPLVNGGVPADYEYDTVFLGNGSGAIILLNGGLAEEARIAYDDGATFPDPNGSSMYLTDLLLDYTDGANWDVSATPWAGSAGDNGTPGAANTGGPIEPPDDDGDGMPNYWELLHFGHETAGEANVDGDGDGQNNGAEYTGDTIPTDPLSYTRITDFDGLLLTFPSSTNRVYQVRTSPDPTDDSSWTISILDYIPTNTTTIVTVSNLPPSQAVAIDVELP